MRPPTRLLLALGVATALLADPVASLALSDGDLTNLGSGGPAPAPHVTSSAGSIGRVLLGLILVVLVIGVLYAGMRRAQRSRLPGGSGGGAIEVLETTPIGPGRNIHLVRVGDRILVVGASEHAIAALATLGRDEAIEEGVIADDAAESLDPAIAAVLGTDVRPARRTLVDALRERTMR